MTMPKAATPPASTSPSTTASATGAAPSTTASAAVDTAVSHTTTTPRTNAHNENDSDEEVTTEEFEIELDDRTTWAMNFYECAAEGDVATLRQILDDNKVGVDDIDVDGFTALMIAAAEGHREIVLELLARGADVSVRTHELRSSALHFAAKTGDADVVEAICKQDPRHVDSWNINADTPLIWACIEGRVACVRVLLAYNADVNIVNQHGATTLICSVMIGEDPDEDESDDARAAILRLLLAKNPTLVNVQDREGSTAMHLAASCGYLECVKTLLALGADITLRNAIGQTPLEEAEQTGLDESDVCVAYLQTIWQTLEEEAAKRMMLMLEMEELAAEMPPQVTTSKKNKKKSKKLKRKAAKQQQQQPVQGSNSSMAERKVETAAPALHVDQEESERIAAAAEAEAVASSSESSDDDVENQTAQKGGTEGRASAVTVDSDTSDIATAPEVAGAWTTVGGSRKQQHKSAAVAVAVDVTDGSLRRTSATVNDASARRALKAPQKPVSVRRMMLPHEPTRLNASNNLNGSLATAVAPNRPAVSLTATPPSAQAKPTSLRAVMPLAPTSIVRSNSNNTNTVAPSLPSVAPATLSSSSPSSSSTLFGTPFTSLRPQRTHAMFPSTSWRATPASASSSSSLLWKRVHGTGNSTSSSSRTTTQRAVSERTQQWLRRLEVANRDVVDALAWLACGLCGDVASDNRQCNVSLNGSGCAQLYCRTCLDRAIAAAAGSAGAAANGRTLQCVKCYQLLSRDEMQCNALAQAQTTALARSSNSSSNSTVGSIGASAFDDPDALLTTESMRVTLERALPTAAHVALHPFYLTPSCDLSGLSNGQLEVLEQAHQLALTQIMETRIANARAQERMQIEEWLKTQRDVLHYAAVTLPPQASSKANAE